MPKPTLRRSSRCRSSGLLARMKASSTSYCRTSPPTVPPRPHPAGVELVQHRLLLGAVRRDGPAVRRPPVADLDEARHVGQSLVDEGAHERLPPSLDRRLPVQRRPHDREQPLPLALADAAVDVQATPDVAADVPVGRGPAVEHPPVVAVRGPQPVLDLERPAGGCRADPVVVGAVGRMDALPPRQPQVGGRLGAGELQPAAVDEQPPPARPVGPDQRRCRVGHRAEAALGLRQDAPRVGVVGRDDPDGGSPQGCGGPRGVAGPLDVARRRAISLSPTNGDSTPLPPGVRAGARMSGAASAVQPGSPSGPARGGLGLQHGGPTPVRLEQGHLAAIPRPGRRRARSRRHGGGSAL